MIIPLSYKKAFTGLLAVLLFIATLAVDRKNNPGPFIHKHFSIYTTPSDSLFIDSLKKVISKGYTRGYGGPKVIQSQKKYINANTALGDYYTAKYNAADFSKFALAEKFYGNVAKLTDGTDGDLADEPVVIRLRDNTAHKLLRLYLSAKPTKANKEKLFSMVRGHNHLLSRETAATRHRISKMLFGSTVEIFYEGGEIIAEKGKGVTCYYNPVYLHGASAAKQETGRINILDTIAKLMKQNPELRLKVESGPAPKTMLDQQYCWEATNNAIRYLSDKQGLSPERFLFYYGQDIPGAGSYKGYSNMLMLHLTFAMDDEEGPAMVPEPRPGMRN